MRKLANSNYLSGYLLKINKIIILGIIFCVITGCNPYIKREVISEGGVKKTYGFAYGQFCGPGWPATNSGSGKKQLQGHLPPVDDIDSLCYAHDYCYSLTRNNDPLCDNAFLNTMESMERKFKEEPCLLLGVDMSSAFRSKFWNPLLESDPGDTFTERVEKRILPKIGEIVVFAALGVIKKIMLLPALIFSDYPEEGDCNLGNAINPKEVILLFENRYYSSEFNWEKTKIEIPYPLIPVGLTISDETTEIITP